MKKSTRRFEHRNEKLYEKLFSESGLRGQNRWEREQKKKAKLLEQKKKANSL